MPVEENTVGKEELVKPEAEDDFLKWPIILRNQVDNYT